MSEKSPILKAYKALQAKVDKMDLRERLLVFTTGLMLVGSIWYMGLMEPLTEQIKNNRTEITRAHLGIRSPSRPQRLRETTSRAVVAAVVRGIHGLELAAPRVPGV